MAIPDSDLKINYRWIDKGKPATFVFINALGTDLTIWEDVVDRLLTHGNILRFDKQGHGLSPLSENTNRLEDYLTDVVRLIERSGMKRCHVIGISVGGMIAQLLAYHHPNLVDKLILCDTRHKIGDANGWNTRIQQVQAGGVAAVADAVVQRWFSKAFRESQPETVSRIREMLTQCSSDGYIQTCKAIRDADLTERSKQIKHKTLVVVGSEDGSTPVADVQDLADLIPGSRFEIIQGSGHLPCVDNPEKLSSLILDFIS